MPMPAGNLSLEKCNKNMFHKDGRLLGHSFYLTANILPFQKTLQKATLRTELRSCEHAPRGVYS